MSVDPTKQGKQFAYMILSRMKSDCEYVILHKEHGIREQHLWAGSIESQIENMLKTWDWFAEDEKPEWLTREEILKFAEQMK